MAVAHPPSVLAYFERVGAEVLNFRRAMIKTHRGAYYIERALIKISDEGVVTCSSAEFAPTEVEAGVMKAELAGVNFPRAIQARNADGLKGLTKGGETFEFWDRKTGGLIMVQERRVGKDGAKRYIPWTQMSDGEWVAMEPDGLLPLWKPKMGRELGKIMIHEGAKAAAFVDALVAGGGSGHPWAEELAEYEHWGAIGGALAPHRTNYEELRAEKPTEVIYVCDNDKPGVAALSRVSQCWGKALKGVVFGDQFPSSWDLADPMPKKLFCGGRWNGPALKSMMAAATWATEVIPPPAGGKGKGAVVLKPEFVEEWRHTVQPEIFVHRDFPASMLNSEEFNSLVAPFSAAGDAAKLLRREFASKADGLKYNPAEPPGFYTGSEAGSYINAYQPSKVKGEKGDAGPWLDFIGTLIADEGDRLETMRWVATLIARPDIRMTWALLLISEQQGVGKGTLGEKILAPLVGEANVSFPSESELVDSNFNYWLAHKRLAVVHEIYAGQSSKAYNKLKSVITDDGVTVQRKYMPNYHLKNWIHIFACSNSSRAIKLASDDRRWFVPKVSEEKRPAAYWEKFNGWLMDEGGLQVIKWWAGEFVKEHGAVLKGSDAPGSVLKRAIIEENYSPGQALVARTLGRIRRDIEEGRLAGDAFVLDTDLVQLIRDQLYDGRHNDRLERPMTVRKVAKDLGWTCGAVRSQIKDWTYGSIVISLDAEVAGTAPADLCGEKIEAGKRRLPLKISDLIPV